MSAAAPDPDARVWLLRFADSRGDSINDSALTTGETLAEVRARQDAGYWPTGKPGAWSPSDPDKWVWADSLDNPEPAACSECHNRFNGKMPGHKYGSNWDWVPCQTCKGTGRKPPDS